MEGEELYCQIHKVEKGEIKLQTRYWCSAYEVAVFAVDFYNKDR